MKAVFTSEVTQVSFLYFHHIKLFKYCILLYTITMQYTIMSNKVEK